MNTKKPTSYSPSYVSGATASAVAIFAGFMDAGIKHMGGITPGTANDTWHPLDLFKKEIGEDGYGCDSIYAMLASWAGLAQDLWDGVQNALEWEGAPGVFDYEVSEEFGNWFWRRAFEKVDAPGHDECSLELGRLCWVFFNRDDDGDTQAGERYPATADAIEKLTGYREHPKAAPAAPVEDLNRYEYNLGGAWIPTTADGYAAHKATGVQVRRFVLADE